MMENLPVLAALVAASLCAAVAFVALRLVQADRKTSLERVARLERDLALALAARDAQDWGRRVAEADEVERQRAAGRLDKDGVERVPTLFEEEQDERRRKYAGRMSFSKG